MLYSTTTASTLPLQQTNALLRRSVSKPTRFSPTRHDIPPPAPPYTLSCQE
ncbi:unnamed protein product [Ectocarpus sp. 6 AP-2014]